MLPMLVDLVRRHQEALVDRAKQWQLHLESKMSSVEHLKILAKLRARLRSAAIAPVIELML